MGGGEVVSIGRHAASGNLGVNLRTAGLGMLEFLKDEDHRAFADHETVAALGEGARGGLGGVVAGRQGVHRVEAAHTCGIYGSLRAAGHHHVSLAETDEVERVDDGVVG